MIVLDTNVLSELMRSQPAPAVVAWVNRQARSMLYTTSISKAEILFGIAAMPDGRRRTALAAMADAMFNDDFAGRILAFDASAAVHYAEIGAARRRAGRPVGIPDAQIAATARSAGAAVATRDITGFEDCGVALIDPWTPA